MTPTFDSLPACAPTPALSDASSARPEPLVDAVAKAAASQQYPPATLYVVATPIGNVADLTVRALHVLGLVDAVACEDTRVSGQLLSRLGLHRPLVSLHTHNEAQVSEHIVARLQRGERIAYVSDAGTPAISDPGARLVAAVRGAGLRVLPVPGVSSVAAALSAAGDVAGEGFVFYGFLPTKSVARAQALADALAASDPAQRAAAGAGSDARALSLVLFEAPHRIADLADELALQAPGRRVTLCRELTKQFEQIVDLAGADLPAWLAAHADHRRGEFVLVVHAQPPQVRAGLALPAAAERLLGVLLAELPLKQAVALAAQALDLPRKTLYQRALDLKQAGASALGDEPDTATASG